MRARVSDIIRAAEIVTGFSEVQLVGERRQKWLTDVRHAISHLAIKHGHSLSHTGRVMRRDHSSIFNGLRRAELFIAREDLNFCRLVRQIEREIPNVTIKPIEVRVTFDMAA